MVQQLIIYWSLDMQWNYSLQQRGAWVWSHFEMFSASSQKKNEFNGFWLKTSSSRESTHFLASLVFDWFKSLVGLTFTSTSSMWPLQRLYSLCFIPCEIIDLLSHKAVKLQHGRDLLLFINTAGVKVTMASDIDWAFVFFNACIIQWLN